MRHVSAFVLSVLVLSACDQKIPEDGKIPLGQLADQGSSALTGVLQEQLAAPPYSYLRLKTGKGEVWAAVPQVSLENGKEVTVYSPMLMTGFESKTLNRTFDEVYFGTLTPAAAPSAATGTAAGGDPHAGVAQAEPPFPVGNVARASAPDGHTVAEVWSAMASLEGRTVSVQGVVVKVNDDVMGKNWIHVRDGSGDAKDGSNDLAVTTMDRVRVGDTVTLRGTVHTNKDFGAGYFYKVIVEDASVMKVPGRS